MHGRSGNQRRDLRGRRPHLLPRHLQAAASATVDHPERRGGQGQCEPVRTGASCRGTGAGVGGQLPHPKARQAHTIAATRAFVVKDLYEIKNVYCTTTTEASTSRAGNRKASGFHLRLQERAHGPGTLPACSRPPPPREVPVWPPGEVPRRRPVLVLCFLLGRRLRKSKDAPPPQGDLRQSLPRLPGPNSAGEVDRLTRSGAHRHLAQEGQTQEGVSGQGGRRLSQNAAREGLLGRGVLQHVRGRRIEWSPTVLSQGSRD